MRRLSFITLIWQAHVDTKFRNCERKWHAAYVDWKAAQKRQDSAAMERAFSEQAVYLKAEGLAHTDMNLASDLRESRWDADYVAEARLILASCTSSEERLTVAQ